MLESSLYLATIGALATLTFIRLLVPVAWGTGLLDWPNHRKLHTGGVPLVGGLGIACAYLLTVLLSSKVAMSWPFALGFLLLLIVGAADDRASLTVRARLCAQLLAAVLLVYVGGVQITSVGDLFGFGDLGLDPGVGLIFSLFCVVSLVNGVNMLDGLDGLAAGVGSIILGAFAVVAASTGADVVLGHAVVFVSCLLAFLLVYNFASPLRRRLVFLGDAGSMTLGYLLAWTGISIAAPEGGGELYPISVVWIMGLVILDTVGTVVRRICRGQSPLRPGRDHLHHLLIGLGLSPRCAVVIAFGLAAAMAGIGVAGWKLEVPEALLTWGFFTWACCYYAVLAAVGRRIASGSAHKVSADRLAVRSEPLVTRSGSVAILGARAWGRMIRRRSFRNRSKKLSFE